MIDIPGLPDYVIYNVNLRMYVGWARKNGLYGSYGCWNFFPDKERGYPMTREEANQVIKELEKEYPGHTFYLGRRCKCETTLTKVCG